VPWLAEIENEFLLFTVSRIRTGRGCNSFKDFSAIGNNFDKDS
jgi:hypothetical protein